MITRPIVVGYDDSPSAQAALEWAATEASIQRRSVLVVYAFSPAREWTMAALLINTDRLRVQLRRDLRGRWTMPLRARNVPYETRLVSGRPGPTLLKCARASEAACIVIGADQHHRLPGRRVGPVGRFVQRHALRPVIVVPPRPNPHPPNRRWARSARAVTDATR